MTVVLSPGLFVRIVCPDITYTKYLGMSLTTRLLYPNRLPAEISKGHAALSWLTYAHAHLKLDNQSKNLCTCLGSMHVQLVRMRICPGTTRERESGCQDP